VLPVPTGLEAWGDDLAPVGHAGAVTLCQPVVEPFRDTRSMPDVLIAAAKELGGEPAKALPWGSFRECIEKAHGGPGGEMEKALQRGGFFGESLSPRSAARTGKIALPKAAGRTIDGDPKAFPLALHLYPSITLYDGRGANLPWLQEMPDPISTAVWRNWIEVNPKTAAGLGLAEGDGVTVTSPSGKITAHVAFNPGVAKDVAAMPLGQGHTRYGKYANGRGENPISLLPAGETYALQATRVALAKTKLSTTLARTGHPEGQWKVKNMM
jgi:anaerobic selenocysteine-containing dehydrogenase